MGLMDDLVQSLANQMAGRLPEPAKNRVAGLLAARAATLGEQLDVYDRIRLARFILTGNEEPPEVIAVHTASGETVAEYVSEQQPLTGVVGPDPEFEQLLVDSAVPPDISEDPDAEPEPAPSAGSHWRGIRGR